jgi:hypothetical protein
MTTSAPVLGGTTLPKAIKCDVSEILVGEQSESGNGIALLDYTAVKWAWAVTFPYRTEAEKDVLRERYAEAGTQAWQAPDGTATYTVVVKRGSWREEQHLQMQSGAPYYTISFELEEYQ